MKYLILLLILALPGCGQKAAKSPKLTINDCTTEPNGDKIWYPNTQPFYPENTHMQFNSWYTVCKTGKWVTDKQRQDEVYEMDRPRRELLNALRTRVLTVQELKQVASMGSRLLVEDNTPYTQSDVDAKFSNLLKIQELMQLAEKRSKE